MTEENREEVATVIEAAAILAEEKGFGKSLLAALRNIAQEVREEECAYHGPS